MKAKDLLKTLWYTEYRIITFDHRFVADGEVEMNYLVGNEWDDCEVAGVSISGKRLVIQIYTK